MARDQAGDQLAAVRRARVRVTTSSAIATAPASLTAFEFWPDGGVQVAFVNDTHHLHDMA